LHTITFASTNPNKFREVQSILGSHDISVDLKKVELLEIQSDSIEKIAKEKAKSAFLQIGRPVIVEDDGLFIEVLKGFPGQYSSHAFKTIGNNGILKLLTGSSDRSAFFLSLIAFHDGKSVSISEGRIEGKISDKIIEGGWGYDPIFVPAGMSLTLAQLKEKKNEYSHRKKALDNFARLYSKA
jgi:XTP/dITP diphosphohydrolase